MQLSKVMFLLCLISTFTTLFAQRKGEMHSLIKKNKVDPDLWVESRQTVWEKNDSLVVNNGEYRINGGKWSTQKGYITKGDKIDLRVRSSFLPNDVTMTQLLVGNDTLLFQVKTKSFKSQTKQGQIRNINLGISGPSSDAIGGISPKGFRYNGDTSKLGSAVRSGLIPNIQPLFNAQIRDAVVCVGGDGRYYLTGSTGNDIWHFNDGVELWVSKDLRDWDYMGLVWSFEKDATWQKQWRFHHRAVRALWAPEIHYVKGNYFITISMPPGDRGLLKSISGKPEGPYVNALANDGRWKDDIDASLFEDEDGEVYLVYGGGWIARMKNDMSGLAEEPKKPILLDPDRNPRHHARTCAMHRNCEDIGHEGAFMFKRNGRYYLTAADTYEGRYSSMVAVSDNIYGPYKWRHEGVPSGGGTSYFRDHSGQWWCTYFGNENQSPFRELPAMIKVDFDISGRVYPALDQMFIKEADRKMWKEKWESIWKNKYN